MLKKVKNTKKQLNISDLIEQNLKISDEEEYQTTTYTFLFLWAS